MGVRINTRIIGPHCVPQPKAKERNSEMIGLIENPPAVQKRSPKLLLHCGGHLATREEVANTSTPSPTNTWQPIPHIELIERVEEALHLNHLEIGNVAHALSHEGKRYFGLMEIKGHEVTADDYSHVVGLRNSHNKTFPVGLVAGATVFVCDNLSFSGEIRVTRKHTRFIQRDLVNLVQSSIGKLMNAWHEQDQRIARYKEHQLTDEVVHDIAVRSVDVGVLPNRKLPELLHEWREPRYEDFHPRTAWSLFNSYTEVLKGNLAELPRRTERLHGLIDSEVGAN
jgi:hypothetical protein